MLINTFQAMRGAQEQRDSKFQASTSRGAVIAPPPPPPPLMTRQTSGPSNQHRRCVLHMQGPKHSNYAQGRQRLRLGECGTNGNCFCSPLSHFTCSTNIHAHMALWSRSKPAILHACNIL